MEQKHISPEIEEDEIDFIGIAKTIWEGRRNIVKSVIACTVIGLFVAIFSPKEYVANGIFVPQISDGKGVSGLSGLAAMAGINIGSNGQSAEISPMIYPQVIEGTDFAKELMESKIKVAKSDTLVTFFNYFTEVKSPSVFGLVKKYTVGLPGIIKKALAGDKSSGIDSSFNHSVEILSEEEFEVKQIISSIIDLQVDDKAGYVIISAQMPEALAAAQVAQTAQDILQKYVTNYKIGNAKKDLHFIEDRFLEKEKEFFQAQEELAIFTDQNKNITSAYVKAQYERLSSDYQLKFNIYNELAKQYEQAKIKVTEDTPTFNTIQKVTVPNAKSAPRRSLILVLFFIVGLVLGGSFTYGAKYLSELKRKWAES